MATLIVERQLVPGAIVRLFWRNSIAKDGESLAVIVLAGSMARWYNCQDGWDGDEERLLALDAVHADAKAFQEAAWHAGLIVRENWPEIVREVQPRRDMALAREAHSPHDTGKTRSPVKGVSE